MQGSKILPLIPKLDKEYVREFNTEILSATLRRTLYTVSIIAVVQILNLLGEQPYQEVIKKLYLSGASIMLGLCLFFGILILFLLNKTLSYKALSAVIYSCWGLVWGASLVFTFTDLYTCVFAVETATAAPMLSNATLFTMVLAMVPMFPHGVNFAFVVIYGAINTAFALFLKINTAYVIQLASLPLVAIFAASFQMNYVRINYINKIQLNKANAQLKEQTMRDPLTNVFNRHGLEDRIRLNLANPMLHDVPIAVMMIDIDYFKIYNDKFLHLAGDDCLMLIAETIDKANGTDGIVARYGGEEFTVVSYNLTREDAIQYAIKTRESIENLGVHFDVPEFPYVTISIGLSMHVNTCTSGDREAFLKSMIDAADKELLNAKTHGKNCVSFEGNIYRKDK